METVTGSYSGSHTVEWNWTVSEHVCVCVCVCVSESERQEKKIERGLIKKVQKKRGEKMSPPLMTSGAMYHEVPTALVSVCSNLRAVPKSHSFSTRPSSNRRMLRQITHREHYRECVSTRRAKS